MSESAVAKTNCVEKIVNNLQSTMKLSEKCNNGVCVTGIELLSKDKDDETVSVKNVVNGLDHTSPSHNGYEENSLNGCGKNVEEMDEQISKDNEKANKDKILPEVSEEIDKDKILPEVSEEIDKDKILPEVSEEIDKDTKVPESSEEIEEDKNLPESSEEIDKDKNLPEGSEEMNKDKNLPKDDEEVDKDINLLESNEEVSNKHKNLPKSNEEVNKDINFPEGSEKVDKDINLLEDNEELDLDKDKNHSKDFADSPNSTQSNVISSETMSTNSPPVSRSHTINNSRKMSCNSNSESPEPEEKLLDKSTSQTEAACDASGDDVEMFCDSNGSSNEPNNQANFPIDTSVIHSMDLVDEQGGMKVLKASISTVTNQEESTDSIPDTMASPEKENSNKSTVPDHKEEKDIHEEGDQAITVDECESNLDKAIEMLSTSKFDSKVTEEEEKSEEQGKEKEEGNSSLPVEMAIDVPMDPPPSAEDGFDGSSISIVNVMSEDAALIESKADDEALSIESVQDVEEDSLKSNQDVLKLNEEHKKEVCEETSLDTNANSGHQGMDVDNHEESAGNQQVMSPSVTLDSGKDVEPANEEEKDTDSTLQISNVVSCKDIDVGLEVEENDQVDIEIEEKEDDCEFIIDEPESTINVTQVPEKLNDIKSNVQPIAIDDTENNVLPVKDQTDCKVNVKSPVLNPPTSKLSFKDILKQASSQKLSSENNIKVEKSQSEHDEAIVIFEEDNISEHSSTSDVPFKPISEETKSDCKANISETTQITKESESSSNDGEQTKKRVLSDEDSEPTSPKRQRLITNDTVINKLGDHVGDEATDDTTVIMDSDDERESTDSPSTSGKITTQDEKKKQTGGGSLLLSSQMLRNLIKASLNSFMRNQKLEKEQQIDDRMKKMEAATELWRETAKHLEKSVQELTSYSKELQKRKSQATKLKNLSNRTVAVQVTLDRTPHYQNQAKAPHSQVNNRSTSLSLPPSVLRHPMTSQQSSPTNRPMAQQAPTNGNMRHNPSIPSPRQHLQAVNQWGNNPMPSAAQQLNRQRVPPNLGPAYPPPAYNSHYNQVSKSAVNSPVVSQLARQNSRPSSASSHIQGAASNMIDLTAEDDTSKQSRAFIKGKVPAGVQGNHSTPVTLNNQTVAANALYSITSPRSASSSSGMHVERTANANSLRNGSDTMVAVVPNSSNSGMSAVNSSSANGVSRQFGTEASTSRSLPPSVYATQTAKHPAPLPFEPNNKSVNSTKVSPPKPSLKISRVAQGIVLSWNMPTMPANVANIASYQLFAYQETNSTPNSSFWKKVGDVKALPLPMACTLVQFQEGNKYYFAVRAIDQFGRWGEYSDPSSIYLYPK